MRFFLLSIILFLCTYAGVQVKKLLAETAIQDVTVFSSGARIERISTLSILPGKTEISFEGLSNQLEQESVQLKANADITLLSVQATKDYLSERKIDQEEKKFNSLISSLQDKIELDSRMLAVYKNEEEMVIKNQAIGGTNGVKATDLRDALDLQRQRLTDVFQKQLEIQKRLAEEQADAGRMKAQLGEISRKKDSVNYIVSALVESKEAKNIIFILSYNIKDAGWYPAYDIRIKEVTDPLQVLMHANIFQRSGETWKDVSLILSTGNPNDNATPSPLQPWMLGFYDPSISYTNQGSMQGAATGRITNENGEPIVGATVMVRGSGKGTSSDQNGFFKIQQFGSNSIASVSAIGFGKKEFAIKPGYFTIVLKQTLQALNDVVVIGYAAKKDLTLEKDEDSFKEKREGIQTIAVATQYQPTTVEYKIDEKYTVETDGKTTTIGIKQFEIPAIYGYLSAPKIDPSVFLTAKIPNWQNYDLQSGEASLYFEGSYLGKTYIDLGTVSDTLSLSLGKDNGIRISRKLIKEYSTKRFIGNSRTESKQFEINVRNDKQVSVNLVINDQFPVSTTKEINVDDQKAAEAQVDKDNGIITWNISLAPGQEKKLTLNYAVKYPKEKKVILEQ
jgi:hypothetical protein